MKPALKPPRLQTLYYRFCSSSEMKSSVGVKDTVPGALDPSALYLPMMRLTVMVVHAPECLRERTRGLLDPQLSAGFLFSLFPLCLAHISRYNSTPPAIPGVPKSRPHSQGKGLREHMDRQTDRPVCPIQAESKSAAPLHPTFVARSARLSRAQ